MLRKNKKEKKTVSSNKGKDKKRVKKSEIIKRPKLKKESSIRQKTNSILGSAKVFLMRTYTIPTPNNKIGKFLSKTVRPPKYFRDSWVELKKVAWPDRRQTIRFTIAVFIFSGFFALITALVDYGFTKAVERIILK